MVSKLSAAWHSESPISFQGLEGTDGPRGTKAGQHQLSAHSQQHTSKLILKSLLDHTSIRPETMDGRVVLPLVRTHASIIAGSAPNAAMTFTSISSDPKSTMTNEEWRINTQRRLGLPLASYHNQPQAPCPHGYLHPQTKEPVKVRYGYHLVTDCLKANQGKKSHKDVEATIIHPLQHLHQHHGDQAQALPGRQVSGHPPLRSHHHRQPRGPELAPRRHVNQPHGVTNQEFINRAAFGHQAGPGEHDPRNDVLTSAKRAEERKHAKYDNICALTGSIFSPFALETTGGHGASTASVYYLFTKQMRDSGLPADVLVNKLKKDIISFALRRGTIAQVTTALDAAQRAAEDELALNEAGWAR
jgi:hypothetical protein